MARIKPSVINSMVRILNKALEGRRWYPQVYTLQEIYDFKTSSPEVYKAILSAYPEDVAEKFDKIIDMMPKLREFTKKARETFIDPRTGLEKAPWFVSCVPRDEKVVFTLDAINYHDLCWEKLPEEERKRMTQRELTRYMNECMEEGLRPLVREIFGEEARVECSYSDLRCRVTVDLE